MAAGDGLHYQLSYPVVSSQCTASQMLPRHRENDQTRETKTIHDTPDVIIMTLA